MRTVKDASRISTGQRKSSRVLMQTGVLNHRRVDCKGLRILQKSSNPPTASENANTRPRSFELSHLC